MYDVALWTTGFIYNLIGLCGFIFVMLLLKFTHPHARKSMSVLLQAILIDAMILAISVGSCVAIAIYYPSNNKSAYIIFKVFTESPFMLIAIPSLTLGRAIQKASGSTIRWMAGGSIVTITSFFGCLLWYYLTL